MSGNSIKLCSPLGDRASSPKTHKTSLHLWRGAGVRSFFLFLRPQMTSRISRLLLSFLLCIMAGCASVGPLDGGQKDTRPPKLVSISPADSLLNTRVTRIELQFDEFIALNDPAKEIQVSPILAIPPTVTSLNKKVTVKIPDSLLMENTTYRISFGSSVKDIHEDNKITGLTYTFSTGSYFDSLEVNGSVTNALTGMADSGATILLYPLDQGDSAVVRSKPLYVGKVKPDGTFSIKGLPGKKFNIYAVGDANGNLVFDGGKETVGFTEQVIIPGDSLAQKIRLRTFVEVQDTTLDSMLTATPGKTGLSDRKRVEKPVDFTYTLAVDSSNLRSRSHDITKPLEITFSGPVKDLQKSKISLFTDSTIAQPFEVKLDTLRKNVVILTSPWLEDSVYTLKFQKGFIKDTAGADALPSKYMFRTKRDDDYAKLTLNIPSKYQGDKYILLVKTGNDTVYNKQIADTTVKMVRLVPGAYNVRIIIDENENGVWDTGDLLLKRQPEVVIPYPTPIDLKAGWDNITDFEPKAAGGKRPASPSGRDKPGGK